MTEAHETRLVALFAARWRGRVGVALYAVAWPDHVEQVRWLLAPGADPDTPTFEGKMPLRVTVLTDQQELADLLRQHGASDDRMVPWPRGQSGPSVGVHTARRVRVGPPVMTTSLNPIAHSAGEPTPRGG